MRKQIVCKSADRRGLEKRPEIVLILAALSLQPVTRHREGSQEHSRWPGKVVLLGYCRALGPRESRRPGKASLGSHPVVQPAPERARPGGRQPARPLARPSEQGLPIVNIYLTSVTPAQHRSLLPPRPLTLPRALPPAPVADPLPPPSRAVAAPRARARAGAGLVQALSAHCARRSCSPADACCPADKCVFFLESERGLARQTQSPPVTVAIPCAPHHICLPQQQQQKSGGRWEEGSRAPQVQGSAWRLRLARVPDPGRFAPQLSVRSAERQPSLRRATPRLLASARGRVAADTLASQGKPRGSLALSPRGRAKTTRSFTCSSEPVADGGTLRPCAV